jgi:hypothetical protein
MRPRAFFIDHLRTTMTFIVLLAHVWMTYGADGTWFYREIASSRSLFSVLGSLYCLTNQAYLMGVFFLLAGYFTPASFDRKGGARFLLDRALRLGIPLLVFGLVLAPTTDAMVAASNGQGFWPSISLLWKNKEFINGPMWFAEGLLLMSLGYSVWRWVSGRVRFEANAGAPQTPEVPPSSLKWLLSALGVGLVSFVLRIWAPVDTRFLGLWIGYFPSYIFLFAVGVSAWRHDWIARIPWKQARLWFIVACVSWPAMPVAAVVLKLRGHNPYFAGGMTAASLLYAMWEPFVAWGVISAALVWFRTSFNRSSVFQDWLSRRAYAVYVIHPPVLVGICLLFRHWHALAPVKFLAVGTLGCAVTWLVADPLVRLPGLRRIF